MALNSLAMLAWIAATVACAWLLPRQIQTASIPILTALFLWWCSPVSLGILTLLVCCSYLLCRNGRYAKAGNLALLCACWSTFILFKAARPAGFSGPALEIIPLGLSFYTLRTTHYVLDGSRGSLPEHSFGEYAAYQFFLPTLMVGPINRFQEFQRSLRRRRWDSAEFSAGCERLLYGYVKIVCLSAYLVSHKLAPLASGTALGPAAKAYLGCLIYGLNLYLLFSGYSDVAIGFARMLGLRVGENFHYPFLARSINDFWQRWHISLSTWCRDYVYLPVLALGRSPMAAILTSMLVLGLWHEFSPRYLVWGIYHGVGIAVWHLFQRVKPAWLARHQGGGVAVCSTLLTMNFVILSFAITRSPDLGSALDVYAKIFGIGG
jgi:D-alanyl-lipoteichoic acid acyltransferase DltB (MBOAT superfamily)